MSWKYFAARVEHMNDRRRKEASRQSSEAFFAAEQGKARGRG